MAGNVDDKIAGLDPARRRKVEDRALELIAEEMTLQELRKARQLTQVNVARKLGISQDGVSRLEQRSDLLLSTLRKTVEAMGGNLSLVAKFPDRPPVELAGLADNDPSACRGAEVWHFRETVVHYDGGWRAAPGKGKANGECAR